MPSPLNIWRLSRWALGLLLLLLVLPSAYARDVSQKSGNLILTPRHGQGEGWGKSRCVNCHMITAMHKTVPKIKVIVDAKGFASCTGCHGQNGTSAPQQCIICHNVRDLPKNPRRTGNHRHDFNLKLDLPTSSDQCIVCHAASDMDGVFEVGQDLTVFNDRFVGKEAYKDVNDFCIRCHNRNHQQNRWPIRNPGKRDQSIAAEEDYLLIDKHGVPKSTDAETALYPGLREGYAYKTIVDCVDCHAMHGTTNPGLIIDNSLKGAFKLAAPIRNKGYKVKVIKGLSLSDELIKRSDYSQLCVLCHDMKLSNDLRETYGGNRNTGNGLSGVHFEFGSDCVTCHSHGERVQKGL